MNKITVKIRNCYGNELIDPLCETAQLFTNLTGRKTLTRADVQCIKALGYEVIVHQEVSKL